MSEWKHIELQHANNPLDRSFKNHFDIVNYIILPRSISCCSIITYDILVGSSREIFKSFRCEMTLSVIFLPELDVGDT